MRFDKMTSEQMLFYVKSMDENYEKHVQIRDRLVQDVKGLQERKEVLSWEEIASAVAYPKTMSDTERISGGNPDEFKLFHQAERIGMIYRSQMEELFAELEYVETQIAKFQFVNRCICQMDPKDREIIEKFTRKNLTFARGEELLHMVRSNLHRVQRTAVDKLTAIYNANNK